MKSNPITGSPKLFGCRLLTACFALLFMGLLGTTLIMLPLASKQSKMSILNAVEEEAGSNNPINEEHKSGKTFSISSMDISALLGRSPDEDNLRVVPESESLPDDQHSQTLIQPPDLV